ncbi:hypothetical protein TL16_g00229 [Triparma laevis f. inornata]|uniref:Uncharacterized protein n=1 Tax=Triparma laevis f. inornata TaxID=1714386 RepID=A0A9W6Z4R3_9STRA|nr:hypothetical protein TL16_g00229 [Triparma laevis f. inornata]
MLKGWTMLNRNCDHAGCHSVWVGKGSVQKCPDCGATDDDNNDGGEDNVDVYDALLDNVPASLSRPNRAPTPEMYISASDDDEDEDAPRPFFTDVDVKTGEMLMAGWTLTGEGCKSGGGIGVVMRKDGKRWCSCCDGKALQVVKKVVKEVVKVKEEVQSCEERSDELICVFCRY